MYVVKKTIVKLHCSYFVDRELASNTSMCFFLPPNLLNCYRNDEKEVINNPDRENKKTKKKRQQLD